MSGGDNGAYNGDDGDSGNNGDYVCMPEGVKAKKEQFINDVLSESIQRVAGFYLHTLKELNEPAGVSFLGPTEYPEPYFGISESGARLNFILEIKEKRLVVCKTQREGKAYRHTYRIAEECRKSMKEFLEKLGL